MSWFQKKTVPAAGSSLSGKLPEQAVSAAGQEASLPGQAAGSPERDVCYKELSGVMASPSEHGVVIKLYIENFKRLNQVFGYDYCEHLLSQILRYLKEKTGKVVYHYIGVEYIMILDGYTEGQASDLAQEIGEKFDHAWKVDGTDCLCAVQMGMCSYPGHAGDPDQLFKCLDLAMLRAGEGAPNQAVMFNSRLQKELNRRRKIALYLQTAVEKQEIDVRYRPTLCTATGRFTRAEFYMRIFIKDLGMIGSSEVLPIAEDSGQIRAIEYYALDQVGRCISNLMKKGVEFESIALPVSSVLFLQEDFLDEVQRVIKTYEIPRGKLAIEISESAITTAFLNINIMLQALSDLGVELVLNDFGSGYSGITTILEFPVDTVKLERLFVWQLETNPRSRHIIEGLIGITKNLDLNIIAEGVETPNQVEILSNAGCTYQQGFYYAPTLEEEPLTKVMGTTLEESAHILEQEKLNMGR